MGISEVLASLHRLDFSFLGRWGPVRVEMLEEPFSQGIFLNREQSHLGPGGGQILLEALTSVLVHVGGDSDVINVGGGRRVEEHGPVQSSIVEEVKVCVLDKVTLGVPTVGRQWSAGALP